MPLGHGKAINFKQIGVSAITDTLVHDLRSYAQLSSKVKR